ncbi:hypothetical protein FNJ87_04880 [Nonlabens mediterrranea]|uniref:Uncharacterized protein n=1 Tax=Nonlabens mediterrranea TaxID=1419947 RepID=A0ABS0A2U4_9FLAO|nr:hypothetical protein [Nonlabens mediterrranea]
MRFFLFMMSCLSFSLVQSQNKVPVNLTLEYTDTLTYDEFVWFGQPGLDFGTSLEALENGDFPYEGFQFINWLDHQVPLHFEEEDTFTIVLGQELDKYSFYFVGEKGAIKNNYILDRTRLLEELERDADFKSLDRKKVELLIESKEDSMVNIASSLGLTEQFIEDEKKYWDYYKAYHNVFYEVLRHKKLDFTLLDLNRFPDMDYDIEKDHFNYRDYFKLSLAYQYLKVNSHEDYDSMKEEVKNIDSRILKFNLSSIWINEIYKRNPHSEFYMKLLKRFSSTSFYYGSVKNLFNKRNRLEIGSSFPYPNTTDFYNKEIDLTKTKGRTVYMFLYAPEDAHLDHNFLNWNSFYLKHRGEDARFITIGLGTDRVRAVFQEVFIKSQIAGSHLSTSLFRAST